MINAHLEPSLFVRVLRMSTQARRDVLELLGSTPVDPDALEELLRDLEAEEASAEHRKAG